MDQLRVVTQFMKNTIAKFITKKCSKYIRKVDLDSFEIMSQKDGMYKIHVNCDIYVTEDQISQFLHNL